MLAARAECECENDVLDSARFLSSMGGRRAAEGRRAWTRGTRARVRRLRLGCRVKLAIADPPYPPFIGSGGRKNRASRWYGDKQRSKTDRPADSHPDASEWDEPARHRKLLADLQRDYDGFAIATSADGIAAYGELPPEVRLLAWVKPNAQPGSHRLRSNWEAVILYPPAGRRSNRGIGSIPDVLIAPVPRASFRGAKPAEWVEWVLKAMSHDPALDTVDDLFPGSGAVQAVLDAA
jgi:hypothetical protein